MLVIEVDTSISIGSPDVGTPAAMGLGVMNGVMPPCGATAATAGSELWMIATRPTSVVRLRYAARQAIRSERREPVCRVAEEIAVEQHVTDIVRNVAAHAGAPEQRAREHT